MKKAFVAILTLIFLLTLAPSALADFSSFAWPGGLTITAEPVVSSSSGFSSFGTGAGLGFGTEVQGSPYQSEKYPLTAKSLRKAGSSRYPEEKKLNRDKTKFLAVVDLTNQVVKVYEKDTAGGYTVLVREMICSTGKEGFTTQPGTFKMDNDYKRFAHFIHYGCYGQYWSLIHDNIYFHSITYSKRDDRYLNEEDFYQLGNVASHGCVRLLPDDEQWIYLYLCPGSTVKITNDIPRDEALRARLMPTKLPEPDCYQYQKKGVD